MAIFGNPTQNEEGAMLNKRNETFSEVAWVVFKFFVA